MKRKDISYKFARDNLYNKDLFLFNYIDDMLNKVNQMFTYENLPVPKHILEKFLTENGNCIFTKENDRYYIFTGGLGGELNEYYEYTKYIVANPYLKLDKEYTIGEDCILIRNDSRMRGLIPILSKYAVMCNDCEISLNMLTNLLRTQYFISASDNKTKDSADTFISNLINGKFTAIGENAFLEGVKLHNVQGTANYIQQFIELNQYLRATAYNEIGLESNYNMKRERLNEKEIMLNDSILIPLAENMLECREIAIEDINKKYGLDIKVNLSSVWKMQKETVDKAIETENTETETETATGTETETATGTETETATGTETETATENTETATGTETETETEKEIEENR